MFVVVALVLVVDDEMAADMLFVLNRTRTTSRFDGEASFVDGFEYEEVNY